MKNLSQYINESLNEAKEKGVSSTIDKFMTWHNGDKYWDEQNPADIEGLINGQYIDHAEDEFIELWRNKSSKILVITSDYTNSDKEFKYAHTFMHNGNKVEMYSDKIFK